MCWLDGWVLRYTRKGHSTAFFKPSTASNIPQHQAPSTAALFKPCTASTFPQHQTIHSIKPHPQHSSNPAPPNPAHFTLHTSHPAHVKTPCTLHTAHPALFKPCTLYTLRSAWSPAALHHPIQPNQPNTSQTNSINHQPSTKPTNQILYTLCSAWCPAAPAPPRKSCGPCKSTWPSTRSHPTAGSMTSCPR